MRPSSALRSCFVCGTGTPQRCSVRITARGYAIADDGFAAPPFLPTICEWTYSKKAASKEDSAAGEVRALAGVMTGSKLTMDANSHHRCQAASSFLSVAGAA
eukprot:2818056-Pleurochrysis_carterae.AAC.1